MNVAVNPLGPAYTGEASVSTAKQDEAGSADRFLKLLVAQMQNQDPLNPMDNAQVTSQMAQINTVSGIEKLNSTVKGLSGQFLQMQALQGASLVGRDVIVAGNQIDVSRGVGQAGFELGSAADEVTVELLAPGGQVIDTLRLGAQTGGVHSFDWQPRPGMPTSGLSFRVNAITGGLQSSPVALMRSTVEAVSTNGNSLQIELGNGKTIPYSDVKAFS